MRLNGLGTLVQNEWQHLSSRFEGVNADNFVVMPNHMHGLLIFDRPNPKSYDLRDHDKDRQMTFAGSVGSIVRAFKASTTLRYARMRRADTEPLWQRNYYDHVVRSAVEMERIHSYIVNNPVLWEQDQENPETEISRHINPPRRGVAGR